MLRKREKMRCFLNIEVSTLRKRRKMSLFLNIERVYVKEARENEIVS